MDEMNFDLDDTLQSPTEELGGGTIEDSTEALVANHNPFSSGFEHETMQQTEEFEMDTSTIDIVANETVLGLEPTKPDEDIYNPETSQSTNTDDERELGSCDCRSECKYNTGKTWKSSDYGYSD